MNKYLSIENRRILFGHNKTEKTTVTKLLLTNNITGWCDDNTAGYFNLFLENSNPFSHYRLYINEDQFLRLCRATNPETIEVKKEGSIFIYSVIQL